MHPAMCWRCALASSGTASVGSRLGERERALLERLEDGRFHSGEELGRGLGISRTAIWNALQRIRRAGVSVHAVRGRGYRLARPLELLREDRVRAALTQDGTVLVPVVDILPEVDSTNEYLKRLAFGGARSGTACLAEWQTCGRGRRGREWVSPFGANVYLSLLWRFSEGTAALGSLSLAAAVAVKRALDESAGGGVELKWPNDVQWHGRKLAGILLELGGEADGPCYVVAGVGINVAMPESRAADIGQPWADLRELAGQVSRSALAGRLLYHLGQVFYEFERRGFAPFRAEWESADAYRNAPVVLTCGSSRRYGIARGIGEDGSLLLEQDGETRRFQSGEVSLRSPASVTSDGIACD